MKVLSKTYLGEYDEHDRISIALETGGKNFIFSIGSGEPEDMSLTRDLSDALRVPDMLRAAYEAGWNKEALEFNELTIKDEE